MLLDNANGTLATEGLASDLDACGVSRCLVQRKVWNSAEAVQTSKTFDESPPETPYSSSGRSSDTVELAPGGREELPSEVPSPRSQTPESAPSAYAAELESSTTFSDFCNDGRAWTWTNLLVKINRWTVSMIKQVYLIFMTLSLPTNHLMLSFRTLPRDFEEPNANGDYLAAKFRNAVMPRRGQLHDRKSMLIKINRSFIECPVLGIPGIVRFIDVRTQWFDEGMQRALDAGIKQVVIIAAGYDTRAYRLHRPGVRFYEVDLPHASRKKQELVRELLQADKYPRPEFVAADLSKVKLADALAHTSFSPYMPTLFTAEGLTYYLPPTALQQLLTCISNSSAPGSHLMMDFLHLSSLSGNVWHPGFETLRLSVYNKGEPMYSGVDERPESVAQLLKLFDFETREVLTARDMVKRYMPHKEYRAKPPTVSPYFGYLEAVKL